MKYPQEKINPYHNKGEKTEQVEEMFDNIAPAYDKLNHILSLNIDKFWRRRAMAWLKPFKPQTILDVATGTGDLALLIEKKLNPKKIVGIDISEGMMDIGRKKVKKKGLENTISFAKENCENLSYSNSSFDAITVAFGIRNFANLDQGLSEMYRVLKPGGQLAILELTSPEKAPMKQLFNFYSNSIIPLLGRMLSKDTKAYHYLPQTIKSFPQGERMTTIIKQVGFKQVEFKRLTFGICTFYMAIK